MFEGMELCVHNYIEATRLAKLTSLQEKFLKHAMNAFPKAKRIVYSTCSLFPEENERVITNVVKTSRAKWRVQDVKELLKGQWNNFGSGMYGSMGTRCLYAKPDTDFTTGFFLAVLDRDQKDFEKSQSNDKKKSANSNEDDEMRATDDDQKTRVQTAANLEKSQIGESTKKKKKKNKHTDGEKGSVDIQEENTFSDESYVKKTAKKKKKDRSNDSQQTSLNESENLGKELLIGNGDEGTPKKKKKKKDKCKEIDENQESEEVAPANDGASGLDEPPKKKKKKSKQEHEETNLFKTEEEGVAPKNKKKKKKQNEKSETV